MRLSRKKRSRVWRIPADEFAAIVRNSATGREIVRHCGLMSDGGNHHTVWSRIAADGIDASHIRRGLNSRKGRSFIGNPIPLEQVLVEHSTYSRGHLKHRLIKSGLLENKCAKCGQLPVWNGEPLVLRLDHFNGINDDNRLENLRLLCPNCDSQTDTFCGRNGAKRWHCISCGKQVGHGHIKCRPCSNSTPKLERRKIIWPQLSELQERIAASSVLQVSKQLGVSDVAVHKMIARMSKFTPTPHSSL